MSEIADRLAAALSDRYRILRELGTGGMATVYLAEDLKHARKVAIKVLRPALAAMLGADRFLKEIQVTANLQHPHILQLYDSGEAASLLYYVMPYVDGETLRERLNREKQLAVDDAIDITGQVAAALDYAHKHHVIHRDIKPENILLQDGEALVADFGIALAVSAAGGTRLTETGLSVGTPHYMSPEQASGEHELRPQTDVYSLGAVVYEMLAGEPPHTAATPQAVIAKVMSAEPQPLSSVRYSVPNNVDAALRKALAKTPADRFKTVAEFADALRDPHFAARELKAPMRSLSYRAFLTVGLASAAVLAGAIGFVLGNSNRTMAPGRAIRIPFSLPGYRGEANNLSLLPDCSGIVHGAQDQVIFRPIGETAGRPVARGALISPSPDSRSMAFSTFDRQIHKIPLGGGEPITIGRYDGADVQFYGGTWGVDRYIYFPPDGSSGLFRISVNGGPAERVTELDTIRGEVSHRFPHVLPDGKGVVYTSWTGVADSAKIMVRTMPNGPTAEVGPGLTAVYSRSGHLVVGRLDGSLQAASFDLATHKPTSPFVTVERNVYVSSWGEVSFSLCDDGMLLYQTAPTTSELVRADGRGGEAVLATGDDFTMPRLSPDATRIAVGRPDSRGNEQIWVIGLDGAQTQVTLEGNNFQPTWSPDGDNLIFTSDRFDGSHSLYMKRADGTGQAVDLGIDGVHPDWSPDGRSVVFQTYGAGRSDIDIWIQTLGSGERQVLVGTSVDDLHARFAPNGRHVSYRSVGEIWVVDGGQPENRFPVSEGGGSNARWSEDGSRIFYVNDGKLMVARVQLEPGFRVVGRAMFAELRDLAAQYDISPDGSSFVSYRVKTWAQLELVSNWHARLEAVVN